MKLYIDIRFSIALLVYLGIVASLAIPPNRRHERLNYYHAEHGVHTGSQLDSFIGSGHSVGLGKRAFGINTAKKFWNKAKKVGNRVKNEFRGGRGGSNGQNSRGGASQERTRGHANPAFGGSQNRPDGVRQGSWQRDGWSNSHNQQFGQSQNSPNNPNGRYGFHQFYDPPEGPGPIGPANHGAGDSLPPKPQNRPVAEEQRPTPESPTARQKSSGSSPERPKIRLDTSSETIHGIPKNQPVQGNEGSSTPESNPVNQGSSRPVTPESAGLKDPGSAGKGKGRTTDPEESNNEPIMADLSSLTGPGNPRSPTQGKPWGLDESADIPPAPPTPDGNPSPPLNDKPWGKMDDLQVEKVLQNSRHELRTHSDVFHNQHDWKKGTNSLAEETLVFQKLDDFKGPPDPELHHRGGQIDADAIALGILKPKYGNEDSYAVYGSIEKMGGKPMIIQKESKIDGAIMFNSNLGVDKPDGQKVVAKMLMSMWVQPIIKTSRGDRDKAVKEVRELGYVQNNDVSDPVSRKVFEAMFQKLGKHSKDGEPATVVFKPNEARTDFDFKSIAGTPAAMTLGRVFSNNIELMDGKTVTAFALMYKPKTDQWVLGGTFDKVPIQPVSPSSNKIIGTGGRSPGEAGGGSSSRATGKTGAQEGGETPYNYGKEGEDWVKVNAKLEAESNQGPSSQGINRAGTQTDGKSSYSYEDEVVGWQYRQQALERSGSNESPSSKGTSIAGSQTGGKPPDEFVGDSAYWAERGRKNPPGKPYDWAGALEEMGHLGSRPNLATSASSSSKGPENPAQRPEDGGQSPRGSQTSSRGEEDDELGELGPPPGGQKSKGVPKDRLPFRSNSQRNQDGGALGI
ncbi:hypothetical protein ABW19_dt0201242 [Dactylella cylindrospora]|nr:hypothetical protein ABW19_dt0201242 [Dactylella cylindrospora]